MKYHICFSLGLWTIATIDFVNGAPLPYRSLTASDLKDVRHRFRWSSLAPSNLSHSSSKAHLWYGKREDPIDAKLDTIPVEYRTKVLSRLLNTPGRVHIETIYREGIPLENRFKIRDSILLEYSRFLIGSKYLELELVELLLQYLYVRRDCPSPLSEINSALFIVNEMREFARLNWNTTMDYLSPRMIMDWSRVFQIADKFRVDILYNEPIKANDDKPIKPRSLLRIEPLASQPMFADRLLRLKLTGYENIDL